MRFGIGAIREKAQRRLMQPRPDEIGRRPDLAITNDGPVKCRLLGPTAEIDPCTDATGRRLVLYPAPAPMSHWRQILYFVLKHALLVIEEVAQRVVN